MNNYDDNIGEFIIVLGESHQETRDDIWKRSNQTITRKRTFVNRHISENDYEKLQSYRKELRSSENYSTYKKAFANLCKFCHIVPDGTIITKFKLKAGKENKNYIFVEYAENTQKIKLPQGTKLYHISKVSGIKKLTPQFRGKGPTYYLYYKPRVYFTIRKDMPKFLADYTATAKTFKYECVSNITSVFVDPLVYLKSLGAVYIETNSPIAVREIKEPTNNVKNENYHINISLDEGVKDIVSNIAKSFKLNHHNDLDMSDSLPVSEYRKQYIKEATESAKKVLLEKAKEISIDIKRLGIGIYNNDIIEGKCDWQTDYDYSTNYKKFTAGKLDEIEIGGWNIDECDKKLIMFKYEYTKFTSLLIEAICSIETNKWKIIRNGNNFSGSFILKCL